jgi:hypothetical protein
MSGLRVLIANNTLATRSGTEIYVRDLADGLLGRGHTPVVYSPQLGDIAQEIRRRTVPVVDDLNLIAAPPDLIHGQHNLETVTALLHFPGVPAVYFFHDNLARHSVPPRLPRVLRYVAVDDTCRDRLILEHGIEERRVCVLRNAVDLRRFKPRAPLPARPARALVFSNHSRFHFDAVRAACAPTGLKLDVLGMESGNACARPEEVIGDYDLVFAKGRSALEAMAVGAAVILCDFGGVGPLVTSAELERLRDLNFGRRALRDPIRPETLAREIARYDAADAAEVTRRVRAVASQEALIDSVLALYDEVLEEFAAGSPPPEAEGRAAADYLRWLARQLHLEQETLPALLARRVKNRLRRLPLSRLVAKWKG